MRGPVGRRVEEIGASPLADCFDIPFGDAVLVVGAYAAEGEGLSVDGALVFEGGGSEDAVVGVVTLDLDVGFAGDGFEVAFAMNGGGGVGGVLAKVEDESAGVVDEEAAAGESVVVGGLR